MLVVLDGAPVAAPTKTPATLRGLIDEVSRGKVGGRIVVSVSKNGHSLIGSDLDSALTQPVSDQDEIFLASAAPSELASEALNELASQFERMREDLPEVADALQAGRVNEAANGLTPLVQALQGLQAVIRQCSQVLNRDLTQTSLGSNTLGEALDRLANQLKELRDILLSRDHASLGDMLRFDLPELCDAWGANLRTIAESIQNGA